MRIKPFEIGVESITQRSTRDEVHLPRADAAAGVFLPQHRALDDVLRLPSLDERLPRLLQPDWIDPELLNPTVLAQARRDLQRTFAALSQSASGPDRGILADASAALADDVAMDEEVAQALSLILRG